MKLAVFFLLQLLCFPATAQELVERFGVKIPQEGVFRSCRSTIDCRDAKDCAAVSNVDCAQHVECRKCFTVLGSIKQCINDPGCEALKSIQRSQCELERQKRR